MKILFDVDGVLINGYNADSAKSIKWDLTLEEELGISSETLTREFFEKRFDDVLVGKKPLLKAMEDALVDLGYNGAAQDIIDFWMKHDSNIARDVFDIVKQLHANNIDLHLATNQEHMRANYLWNDLGFKKYFKRIFYSGKIGYLKPHPKYFEYINQAIGADNILFFDDRIENILAAETAGWEAVEFRNVTDLTNHPTIKDLLS